MFYIETTRALRDPTATLTHSRDSFHFLIPNMFENAFAHCVWLTIYIGAPAVRHRRRCRLYAPKISSNVISQSNELLPKRDTVKMPIKLLLLLLLFLVCSRKFRTLCTPNPRCNDFNTFYCTPRTRNRCYNNMYI